MSVRSLTNSLTRSLLGIAALTMTTAALSQMEQCGSLASSYGPFDYRTDQDKLPIVNGAHFPPIVEALIRGNTGPLGADLAYTLRTFPNHHRALVAVMRYGQKTKSPQPRDLPRPVECYFDRALRFRADDSIVRMIYAQFLFANARKAEAEQQLEAAAHHAAGNGFTHNNVGLIYFDMKEYQKALAHARKATELGFDPAALREQLRSVGKWEEATPAAPDRPASSGSAPR